MKPQEAIEIIKKELLDREDLSARKRIVLAHRRLKELVANIDDVSARYWIKKGKINES